jgi:hypothetical protein
VARRDQEPQHDERDPDGHARRRSTRRAADAAEFRGAGARAGARASPTPTPVPRLRRRSRRQVNTCAAPVAIACRQPSRKITQPCSVARLDRLQTRSV